MLCAITYTVGFLMHFSKTELFTYTNLLLGSRDPLWLIFCPINFQLPYCKLYTYTHFWTTLKRHRNTFYGNKCGRTEKFCHT